MGHPRAPKRPRLATSLVAWVILAALLCLHRTTRVTKCTADPSDQGLANGATAAATALSQQEVESLIRQPATLHGVVQKGGLPANYSFMVAHLTDTDPNVREEGIPGTMGPAVMRWFAHAFT